MVPKIDQGDIIAQEKLSIGSRETAGELWDRASDLGIKMFKKIYPSIKDGTAPRIKQEGKGSYFGKRRPADGKINWNLSSAQIYNLIRAVTKPLPGAFTFLEGEKLYIWDAIPYENNKDLSSGEIFLDKESFFVGTTKGDLKIIDFSFMGNNYSIPYFSGKYQVNGKKFE